MDKQEIQIKAKELIELKREIKRLIVKEKELKTSLMSSIKKYGAVGFDIGRVSYVESKGSETFSRKAVLQYLSSAYGDALAEQVDEDCTKKGEPRKIMYVYVNDL